jgi:uridine kinase
LLHLKASLHTIMWIDILITRLGLHSIAKMFPKVRIITSMVDPDLSPDRLYIEPGFGSFSGK